MKSHQLFLIKSFLFLFLFTCMGIFLHELSHHLFGVQSILGLSRNYPLVPVSSENVNKALTGDLAGPAANLLLAFIGLLVYRIFADNKILNSLGMFLGVSNAFLALSGAVINLIADLTSGKMVNDLEKASSILGINILILPLGFSLLSLIPFRTFLRYSKRIASNKVLFVILIFAAWFAGGGFLMILDSIFAIRIS